MRPVLLAALSGLLASASLNAAADCYVCDDLVVLDRKAAACFLESFESFAGQSSEADGKRIEFDTTSCIDPDEEKPRGGLSLMPTIGGMANNAPKAKSRYTLDNDTAACLKGLLETYDGPFDPDAQFDLAKNCPQ
mgnify:CR=1 FL=1